VFHLPVRVGMFFVCLFFFIEVNHGSNQKKAWQRKEPGEAARVVSDWKTFFFNFLSFFFFFFIEPTGWTETETGKAAA
jgi:hypothetical protein